jgi:hypothetical protein
MLIPKFETDRLILKEITLEDVPAYLRPPLCSFEMPNWHLKDSSSMKHEVGWKSI